jgi:hypothetical protein
MGLGLPQPRTRPFPRPGSPLPARGSKPPPSRPARGRWPAPPERLPSRLPPPLAADPAARLRRPDGAGRPAVLSGAESGRPRPRRAASASGRSESVGTQDCLDDGAVGPHGALPSRQPRPRSPPPCRRAAASAPSPTAAWPPRGPPPRPAWRPPSPSPRPRLRARPNREGGPLAGAVLRGGRDRRRRIPDRSPPRRRPRHAVHRARQPGRSAPTVSVSAAGNDFRARFALERPARLIRRD